MRRRFATSGWIAAGVTAVGLAASPAMASTITFDQTLDSGTIFYGGTGGAMTGSGITIQTISPSLVDPPPFNPAVDLVCGGCVLDFTTGTNVSEGPAEWVFNGGGSFTIMGGVLALGIPGGSTLLSGSFIGNVTADLTGAGTLIISGAGLDFKHPKIVDFYFGIVVPPPPDNDIFLFTNTEITATPSMSPTEPGGFTALVTEADVTNRLPEPGSALLLLLGLGSLAAYRTRRS